MLVMVASAIGSGSARANELQTITLIDDDLPTPNRLFANVAASTTEFWHNRPFATAMIVTCVILAADLLWRYLRKPPGGERRVQSILESFPDAVALFNAKNQLTAINQKLQQLMPLEVKKDAFAGTTTSDLYAQLSPDNIAIERARNKARELAEGPDSTLSFEVPSYGRRALLVKERPMQNGGTAITVSGNYRAEDARSCDPLTALPNRTQLVHELTQRCSRTKNELALIIVDLRSFRQINDTYGREAGDELLKQTAICLQHCMPDDALIARTAGDEFAVLLDLNKGRPVIEKQVSGFLIRLRKGLAINELNVPVRASVGIAFAPEHGKTVASLIKSADSACAHAKRRSNNTLVVYNSRQQRAAKRRHQLEVGLQQAIAKNQLSLQYQPQIDITSKMTCGMEALLRWNSQEFGRVSPADFIPIAEQTGIISELGNWVLNQAIKDYQRLARYGMSPATLSVNLSRKQFDNGRIVSEVARVLEKTGFDPSKLCLEITETALFNDSSKLRKILKELTELGTVLAIDDFGVGYSSLLELRDFPISEVKIDRAFIMDIASNNNSQDIVQAVVDIARSIGADVVAEGIETQEQFDTVAALGCDRAQGYYLCEPMAATTFPDVVLGA